MFASTGFAYCLKLSITFLYLKTVFCRSSLSQNSSEDETAEASIDFDGTLDEEQNVLNHTTR